MAPTGKTAATKTVKKKAPSSKRSTSDAPVWQKILNVLATLEAHGDKQPSRKKVASMCGIPDPGVSTFKNAVSQLKKHKKFINVDKDAMSLTELGRPHAEAVDPVSSNQELIDQTKEKLSAKGKTIVDMLTNGSAKNRLDIAGKCGRRFGRSAWGTLLG